MGKLILNGVAYTGTGTSVIPNPSNQPTQDLKKIRIEDTIFKVGLTTTVIFDYDVDSHPNDDYYILRDSVYNYDYIYMLGRWNIGGDLYHKSEIYPPEVFDAYYLGAFRFGFTTDNQFTWFRINDPQSAGGEGKRIDYVNNGGSRAIIKKIVGIKL